MISPFFGIIHYDVFDEGKGLSVIQDGTLIGASYQALSSSGLWSGLNFKTVKHGERLTRSNMGKICLSKLSKDRIVACEIDPYDWINIATIYSH